MQSDKYAQEQKCTVRHTRRRRSTLHRGASKSWEWGFLEAGCDGGTRTTKMGVEKRKIMNVSTLAYCNVLMLVKIAPRKAMETGANATTCQAGSAAEAGGEY